MRIGGTAVEPALTGYASLVRGRVEIEPLGVTVGNIQLAGAVFEHDYTTLTGSFTSGKGTGRINASVKFAEFLKPEIALELTGQNLTVANVPDMTVRVNPDLRMKWLEGALDVNGSVLIPYARISPRYLPTTNASESDDLVIVAGQKKFSDENLLRSSRLRINGSVSVELGEQVGVSFQRAKAKLQGKTTFTWKDNLVPVGDGMYTVSGKISAYGQALEVDEGRVSFPLVPANNPHLNIKAEREIYGNVQIKKAGVLITGTLKRPVLENYTSPVTTEERALALLITGHDFDYDQGVGAVEVGLYIAPKLYVSYGIGLFEPQSVISVRYDLKRGWGIKATSGQRETGADISYTIDH
jgi:translocation and assembly module TamB